MDAMQILWKMSMMLKTLKNDAETKRVASVKKIDESQVELKENSVMSSRGGWWRMGYKIKGRNTFLNEYKDINRNYSGNVTNNIESITAEEEEDTS